MSTLAPGVLPDPVSKDARAESWLIFVDLLSTVDVATWLKDVATPAVAALTTPVPDVGDVAVCTVGFGSAFFDKAKHPERRPLGLTAALPSEVPAESHDVVFYIFSLSDAVLADFLRTVAGDPASVSDVVIERGYQRANKREVFGQLDGLRNVIPKSDRPRVAFLGDGQPDEPAWATGGSYMAYLKIKQNVADWARIGDDERARLIGRREDGSRLDLPAGTAADDEPPFAAVDNPPATAHVRKAGPRGPNQDTVRIFRRGTPFIECEGTTIAEGLHFVSYQASIDDFMTILQRWMLNVNFPTPGAGPDALFAAQQPLATFLKGGLYFAVPTDDRFIGAGLFGDLNQTAGVLQLRLTVTDASGNPDPTASLEGATFQVTAPSGTALPIITTNAAGHGVAPGLPTGVVLTVTETAAPSGATIASPASQTITLDRCAPGLLQFKNARSGQPGNYT